MNLFPSGANRAASRVRKAAIDAGAGPDDETGRLLEAIVTFGEELDRRQARVLSVRNDQGRPRLFWAGVVGAAALVAAVAGFVAGYEARNAALMRECAGSTFTQDGGTGCSIWIQRP